jgi:hypothetical protein
MMINIFASLKEERLYVFPSMPGKEKSGAVAPIANVG